MKRFARATLFSLGHLLLATALGLTVFLPWFELPLLGWSVPAPAWNRAGLSFLLLTGLLMLRVVGGYPFRWVVRLALVPALLSWWKAPELVREWGGQTLAPLQLRLNAVNQTLSSLGAETITVYEPALWRTLAPGWGWKVAGLTLVAISLLTFFDGARRPTCSACRAETGETDHHCYACGESLGKLRYCSNCGSPETQGDTYCRCCGTRWPA